MASSPPATPSTRLGRAMGAAPAPWLPPLTVSAAPAITITASTTRSAVSGSPRSGLARIDEDGRDVEQSGGARHSSAGDSELVGDLEQRHEGAPAQPDQQPRPALDAEQLRPEQAVHDHPGEPEEQPPEADPRNRLALAIQRGGQGTGGSPDGARGEREGVPRRPARARRRHDAREDAHGPKNRAPRPDRARGAGAPRAAAARRARRPRDPTATAGTPGLAPDPRGGRRRSQSVPRAGPPVPRARAQTRSRCAGPARPRGSRDRPPRSR